jgi:hypothetical protein
MTRGWVRLVLVGAGLAAMAAAGFIVWSSDSQARASATALRLAADAGRLALADAADLRNAQQGYVAVGQGQSFWFARVDALSKDLDEVLQTFRSHLTSPEALADADAAAGILRDFPPIDARARDYVSAGQLAQASDVIYSDGFDVTHRFATAISGALTAETTAHDRLAADLRRREVAAAGGAAAAVVLVMFLLLPGRRADEGASPLSIAAAPSDVSQQTLDDLQDFGGLGTLRAPAAAPDPGVDLAAVASVCGELAKVTDTADIPALLKRAAGILDAAGIVLWIADPDGRELSPIVVHGYSTQIASRLGTIARDAANVTAIAYRTGLLQTVKADAVSNGAVAAPLNTPAGCLGVMAAEMNNGGEQRAPLLAAAAIIASQLSTLVGPPSARARAEAAG